VKELLVVGLDPKHDLTNKHVTIANIAAIFGNVNTFKTTNPLLSPDARKEIETLYWIVKGWIVEWNGHPINWATIVVAIAK
jgi:hypothetical protein